MGLSLEGSRVTRVSHMRGHMDQSDGPLSPEAGRLAGACAAYIRIHRLMRLHCGTGDLAGGCRERWSGIAGDGRGSCMSDKRGGF